jgi:hypothetical protein
MSIAPRAVAPGEREAAMKAENRRVWVLAGLFGWVGCTADVASTSSECILDGGDAESERSPGYPYEFQIFRSDIAPLLAADCTAAGCHADAPPPGGGNGVFTVFATADESCDRVRTFKQFRAKVDLTVPSSSRILFALRGGALTGDVPHPLDYRSSDGGEAKLETIEAFIDAASRTCIEGGGCAPDVRDYFDYEVFQTVIQPGLAAAGDGAGCSAAGCHAPPDGQSGFSLAADPARDSAAMQAAYQAVKARISLDADPRATTFYAKATVVHGGGASTTVDADTADAILAWIGKAIDARGDGDDLGCANPAVLDLGVFRDEILPILRGDRDLNGGGGIATGCTRPTCHGEARPGALTLLETDSPEDQLANFACFVSLTSPASSQLLLCPRKDSRCIVSPHPGDRIFGGATDDLNYQRLLSYLFSAVTETTPIDFAFYALRINPIFDTRNAVQGGEPGLTCADTNECHGITEAGDQPPNRANLAIIQGAGSDMNRLRANFTEASAFINFLSPDQSSLFLYPTDEIADVDNPAATGVHHPGGLDFAVDSGFARDILSFAQGLRPDADGFQRSWLIAGDFQGATSVDDPTAIDEDAVRPFVFDDTGGGELAGRWDGLFSDAQLVDVGAFLTGNPGGGRLAYAAAYLYNTTTTEREVDIELHAVNQARLLVGDTILDIPAGGTATTRVDLPSTRASDAPTGTLLLVKLFESPADGAMRFSIRLLRAGGDRPYTDAGGELLVKLGPRGGI